MPVILGPYPLCPMCRETNGGLIAVRHRQVHLRAHGQQACVDRGLAGLWPVYGPSAKPAAAARTMADGHMSCLRRKRATLQRLC